MSDTNLFCLATIANKHTSTIYNNLMGSFPFMSLKGNICFLVVYHYETNAILATLIAGFSDKTILAAYLNQFEFLLSKGFNIKLNVIDNQASQVVKKYLTRKDCNIMLIEPHNHRVNATEHAIQTFKAHFIRMLATTNSNIPFQLWDHLMNQVETTLNLMCPSRIDLTKSANEAIYGPYDWNYFPLAPPGCKALI